MLGALIGWGVAHDQVLTYEEHLRQGRCLVGAAVGAAEVAQARTLLAQQSRAIALRVHGGTNAA